MNTVTFRDIALSWQQAKRPLVRKSTYYAYAINLNTHLMPVFGSHTVITESEVQQFVIDKLTTLNRKTVHDILALLKTIVKFGAKHYSYPLILWEISFPTEITARKLPTLTLAHQRKLIRYLSSAPSSQNIGILLALYTGMRIGEICALRWGDIDLLHHTITVTSTVERIYNCDNLHTEKLISSPKTVRSNREIPIAHALRPILRAMRSDDPLIFVVGGGTTPKEPRNYRDYFTRMLARLGIPKIVFHGLRHTFATRCIESRCDYKTVSAILGHSNVSTTLNLYVHPDLDQKKRCMARMTRFVGK